MTQTSFAPCAKCGNVPQLDELVLSCPCGEGNYTPSTPSTETRMPDHGLALAAYDGAAVFDPAIP